MNVTEDQISAMLARLKKRQEDRRAEADQADRRAEADIDEVIALAGKHRPFPEAPVKEEPMAVAVEPERMICHEVLTMARRWKLIEDVTRIALIAVWAVCAIMAFSSWRAGGSPGAWLAAAEICLIPYLAKVPSDVKSPPVVRY